MVMTQTVTIDGNTITLTQQAYISESGDGYQAHGTDAQGNEYMVHWDIVADSDDESDACEWDKPTKAVKL